MTSLRLVLVVGSLCAASSSTAFAWTAEEEAAGWVRSDERSEWYHDETTVQGAGVWQVSRADGDPDSLELTNHDRVRSMTIMIMPSTDGKAVKEVTADKTKGARSDGGKPVAWKTALKSGLKWVGSRYTTRTRDDDGDAFDMLHVFGYVTDGTHYAVIDFLEEKPTPNLRPEAMLQPTLESIRFGKQTPSESSPTPRRKHK